MPHQLSHPRGDRLVTRVPFSGLLVALCALFGVMSAPALAANNASSAEPNPAYHATVEDTGAPVPSAGLNLAGYSPAGAASGEERGLDVWTGRGPWGANVRTLLADPYGDARVLCAAGFSWAREAGGVWVSDNGGIDWEDSDLIGKPVNALAPSLSQTGVFWAAVYDGLYRSTDRGAHWTRMAYAGTQIIQFGVKADDGDVLIAGLPSNQGIRRSTDGGATWSPVGVNAGYMKGLGVSPALPSRMYLVMSGASMSCRRSTDGGATWTAAGPAVDAWGIWVDPANADRAFMTTSNGVYRTVDGAQTWTLVRPGTSYAPVSYRDGVFYAPIITGGVYQSTDGGTTWIPSGQDLVEQFWQASSPTSAGILVGHWGGVYRTESPVSPWVVSQTGLNNAFVHNIAYYAQRGELWAGSDGSGLWRSLDQGATWELKTEGLGDWTIYSMAPRNDRAHPADRLYVATGEGLYRSDDHGETWALIAFAGIYVQDVAVDPTHPDRVWIGTYNGHIYRSENGGDTWVQGGVGIPFALYPSLRVSESPLGGVRLHAAFQQTASATYYSDDLGATFTPSSGLGSTQYQTAVSFRPSAPGQPALGYCTTDLGVFISHDRGENWQHVGLSGLWWSLLGEIGTDVYAGGNLNGIRHSSNEGATWVLHNDGIPGNTVWDICYGDSSDQLFCALRGAGVRERSRESAGIRVTEAVTRIAVEAHPNPFGGDGRLELSLPAPGEVRILVHDTSGAVVARAQFDAPERRLSWTWPGTREDGSRLTNGVYYYTVRSGGFESSGKWTLLR